MDTKRALKGDSRCFEISSCKAAEKAHWDETSQAPHLFFSWTTEQ